MWPDSSTAARPRVSVCLATCNGERYLREQIASVLAQLQPGDELLVADDGSSDGTQALVAGFADARVHWLPGGRAPLGVVHNFERALRSAGGDVIFLCDQDDVWLDGKVALCLQALHGHMMVVTDCTLVDGELKVLAESFFAQLGSGPGVLKNLWRNSYLGCCMAFRRQLLEWALPMPAGIPMHDMWLGLVAQCQRGGVLFLRQPLVLYRRHGAVATTTGSPSSKSWGQRIALRLWLAWALATRLLRGRRALAPEADRL
jgi:glycosyltransferase involved in cell wall biosynthesis